MKTKDAKLCQAINSRIKLMRHITDTARNRMRQTATITTSDLEEILKQVTDSMAIGTESGTESMGQYKINRSMCALYEYTADIDAYIWVSDIDTCMSDADIIKEYQMADSLCI